MSKFSLRRLKHCLLDMQEISQLTKPHQQEKYHFLKWHCFKNEDFTCYSMEVRHGNPNSQLWCKTDDFSARNGYLHHRRNAGNARKAGTFHANLKAGPDTQCIRNSECLHLNWFVYSSISVHYLSIFGEIAYSDLSESPYFVWCLKSPTHNCTQHDSHCIHAHTEFCFKKPYCFVTLSSLKAELQQRCLEF